MGRLDGKVAIVTGGASGIGKATVEAFVKEGAKVIISDVADGTKLAEELNTEGDNAIFVKADVTSEEDTKALVKKAVEKFGKLDIVFANAGIGGMKLVHEESFEDWRKVLSVNLDGVFLLNKYAIEQMLKQGTGGSIINNDSIHGFVGKPGVGSYAASKGGVKLLTQTAGIEYGKENIRVNCINPGYIDTPLLKDLDDEMRQSLVDLHPIGRLGRPEEVANAVVFLASDEASFITGTTLLIDGGYTAQ